MVCSFDCYWKIVESATCIVTINDNTLINKMILYTWVHRDEAKQKYIIDLHSDCGIEYSSCLI